MLPPELIDHEVETRDEQNLKKLVANEPLELVVLDPNHPEAIMRMGTKMGFKIRRQITIKIGYG